MNCIQRISCIIIESRYGINSESLPPFFIQSPLPQDMNWSQRNIKDSIFCDVKFLFDMILYILQYYLITIFQKD